MCLERKPGPPEAVLRSIHSCENTLRAGGFRPRGLNRDLPLADSEKDANVTSLWRIDYNAGAKVGMCDPLARLKTAIRHQEILG
jgi:hypothetical protein